MRSLRAICLLQQSRRWQVEICFDEGKKAECPNAPLSGAGIWFSPSSFSFLSHTQPTDQPGRRPSSETWSQQESPLLGERARSSQLERSSLSLSLPLSLSFILYFSYYFPFSFLLLFISPAKIQINERVLFSHSFLLFHELVFFSNITLRFVDWSDPFARTRHQWRTSPGRRRSRFVQPVVVHFDPFICFSPRVKKVSFFKKR